jgi:hypothetical protein
MNHLVTLLFSLGAAGCTINLDQGALSNGAGDPDGAVALDAASPGELVDAGIDGGRFDRPDGGDGLVDAGLASDGGELDRPDAATPDDGAELLAQAP